MARSLAPERGHLMGIFDKIKQAVSGAASTAIQQAEESATNSVTSSIGSSISGAAENAVGSALGHVPGVPGSSILTDAVEAGTNSAIGRTVDSATEGETRSIASKLPGAE